MLRSGTSFTRCVLTGTPHLQHALTIQRQTGGLGISIAGGKGSTPYKGDDEVSLANVESLESSTTSQNRYLG